MEGNNENLEDVVEEIVNNTQEAGQETNPNPDENNVENQTNNEDEVATLKNSIQELEEKFKRRTAEFENYKKRSQKEREGLYNMVTADVVAKILPILDNLENASKANTDDKAYQDGVVMVYNQFLDVLKKFNVETIETVGKTFDPEFHEAVSHVDDDTKGPQEIVQEYRKGYKIGLKVIRHSMVVVAN